MSAFRDRTEAGRVLAGELGHYSHRSDVVILALPRGGVPVALEVARTLEAPLDVFLVRKLGVPGQEELALGAIASGGVRILNPDIASHFAPATVEKVARHEQRELERRERLYRNDRPLIALRGTNVIAVDDGLATGASMRAAVAAIRQHKPARIVVAVPVGAPGACEMLDSEADEVVCVHRPEAFYAVGVWYENFPQISDQEVAHYLHEAERIGHHAVGRS